MLRNLGDRLEYLRGLDKRKEEVTASITEQGAMTPELTAALAKAKTLAEVEDLYRPYKPKRKTRASIAKARGLQPLADAILKQDAALDPQTAAADYLNEEVPDAEAALAGARDIIAEKISDGAACRAELRRYYRAFGRIASTKAKEEDSVYAQYYDYSEPIAKIPGHRVLALDRGEREGFLKVSIEVDSERAGAIVAWMFARKKTGGASAAVVEEAALDAYSRLIHPSLSNELRNELSETAAEGAIKVFGDNLRQLLLQPPIRGKTVTGAGPRLPHGLQGGGGGPHRQGAGHQRGLPGTGVQTGGPGQAHYKGNGAQKRRGGHGHRQRHGGPRDRGVCCIGHPGAGRGGRPASAVYGGQRSGGLGVFGQQAGGRGIPPV